MIKQHVFSNAPWEKFVGYCRAAKVGNHIEISGTTAVDEDGNIHGNSIAEQTEYIILKAEKALNELGASLNNVVRTRMFVTDISKWEEAGKVHGSFFKDIQPATTMVEVSTLIQPELLIEIEFTAIVNA